MDIQSIVKSQQEYFLTDATLPVAFRLQALEKLKATIQKKEKQIETALKADLNKSDFEAQATEISLVIGEINFFIKHLHKFAKPKKAKANLAQFPAKNYILPVPFGVCLIMSPWNYPFQLCIEPLIGAIAAGNTAVLKPSNYSPATSDIINEIITETFDAKYVSVVLGGRDANTALLDQKFDYIFFTGGITVGKLVMESASKHLTPITLELGGKSPCIVDSTADVSLAAKRIVWGKYLNAGQTCVAPDYILVHSSVKERFIANVIKSIKEFYTEKPLNCPNLPRIVNEKHFLRLLGLINGEKIVFGGGSNKESLQIEPTVLDNITFDSPAMREEIFGPIMPILTFENIEEVIAKLKQLPHPLALYLFSLSEDTQDLITRTINFGGGCINDVVVQVASSNIAFGGVGDSGMGGYHGKSSFDTFTHFKSIVHRSNLIDVSLRYLPPTAKKLKGIKKALRD